MGRASRRNDGARTSFIYRAKEHSTEEPHANLFKIMAAAIQGTGKREKVRSGAHHSYNVW